MLVNIRRHVVQYDAGLLPVDGQAHHQWPLPGTHLAGAIEQRRGEDAGFCSASKKLAPPHQH
jgi:hypothetical protein